MTEVFMSFHTPRSQLEAPKKIESQIIQELKSDRGITFFSGLGASPYRIDPTREEAPFIRAETSKEA